MKFYDRLLVSAVILITALMISSGSAAAFLYNGSSSHLGSALNSGSGTNTYLMTVTIEGHSYKYYEEVQNGKVIKTWPALSPSQTDNAKNLDIKSEAQGLSVISPESLPAESVVLSDSIAGTWGQSMSNPGYGQAGRTITFAPSLSITYGPVVAGGTILKDSGSNSGSQSPSTTFNVPSTGTISVTQGDIVMAVEYSTYSGAYGTPPSKVSGTSAISGFSEIAGAQISASGYGNLECWSASVASTGTLQVAFTSNGAGVSNDIYGLIFKISGTPGWSVGIGTGSGSGKLATISSPLSYAGGDLLVGLLGAVGDIGNTDPKGSASWTDITTYGTSQHDATGSTANEYQVTTSPGTISTSTTIFSLANSAQWLTILLDFTPTYSGPTGITMDQGQSMLLYSSDKSTYYWWVDYGSSHLYTGTHANTFEYSTSSYGYTSGPSTSYTVVLSDSATLDTGTHLKASVAVVVYPSLSISTQPVSATIDAGYLITLISEANGGTGSSNIHWQWYDSSGKIIGQDGTGYTATISFSSPDTGIYVKFYDSGVSTSATGGGSSVTSSSASVTVNPALVAPTVTPSSTTLDQGQPVVLSFNAPTTGTPSYIYQWYYGSNDTAISGATGTSYTFTTTSSTATGTWSFYVSVTDSATIPMTVNSPPVTVTVNITPSVTIVGATIDSGMTATLTAVASGGSGTGYVYNWYSDIGLTDLVHTGNPFDTPSLVTTTTYYVVVEDSLMGVSGTEQVTVTVNELPSILVNPDSNVMDADQSFTTLVSQVQYGSGPYTWQWYDSLNNPVGPAGAGTTASYIPTIAGSYYVIFTDSFSQTAVSGSAVVTVNTAMDAPSISVSPENIDDGQATTLSIDSPASGGTAPYTYEWYISDDGLVYVDFGLSDGSSSVSTGSLTTGTHYYYLEVTDHATAPITKTSNVVTVTVNAAMTSSSLSIDVSQSEVDIGQPIDFYVSSFDGSGTPPYIAQWLCQSPSSPGYYDLSGEFYFDPVALSSNSYYLMDGLLEEGTWSFELSLTDSANPGLTIYSNVITVVVDPTLTVYINGPSTIDSTQPEVLTSNAGGGSGSYTTYQWYQDSVPVGTDSVTFDLSSMSEGYYAFYVTVMDTNTFTATSDPFYLTVNSELVAPTVSPSTTYLDLGQSLLLTSTAIGTGTPSYNYQWYQDGTPIDSLTYPMAATDSLYFVTGFLENGTATYSFYLEVTDSADTPMVVDSVPVSVVVNEALVPPDVTPASIWFDQGGSVTLSLDTVTTGTPPYYYQWSYMFGAGDFSEIIGENGASYDFITTSTTAAGKYYFEVTVTDSATTQVQVTTTPVEVHIYQLPNVEVNPSSSSILLEQTGTFSAIVDTGDGPFESILSCEWQLGDSSGPTGASLGTYSTYDFTTSGPGATVTTEGTYYLWVTIQDYEGQTATSSAIIHVLPAPSILTNPSSALLDVGQSTALTAVVQGGSGAFSWQWYIGLPGYGEAITDADGTGTIASFIVYPLVSSTYYVVFTDTGINPDATPTTLGTVTSAFAIVVVNQALEAPTISIGNEGIDDGQSTIISIDSTASYGTAPYTFEWYYSTDGYSFLSLAPSDGISPMPTGILTTGTYYYFLEVIDSATSPSELSSNTVMVTVNDAMTSTAVTLTSTNTELDLSQVGGLYVDSFDMSGTPSYVAQWYVMAPGEISFNSLGNQFYFDPYNLPYLALTPDILTGEGSWMFELSLTDSGNPPQTVFTNIVTITVDPEPTVYITGPEIMDSAQPESLTANPGGGSGSYIIYQWYQDYNPVGTNSDTFDLSVLPEGFYTFYVTVTDSNYYSIDSELFSVSVNPELVAPSIGPSTIYLDFGQSVQLTSSGVTTGTSPYYYQWYQDGIPIDTIEFPTAMTDSILFSTGLFDNDTGKYTIYLEVTDSAPTAMIVQSDPVTIVVNTELVSPGITPSTAYLDQGGTQIMQLGTVTTGTAPYHYQWSIYTGDEFVDIIGANSDSYSFSTTTATPAGTYYLLVTTTDSADIPQSVNSAMIEISVFQAPNVAAAPTTATISIGQAISFSALVSTGDGPFADVASYEWQLGDASGPTGSSIGSGSSLDFTTSGSGATVTTPGTYYLWVTTQDVLGTYASSFTVVNVVGAPSMLTDTSSVIIDNGQSITLSATIQQGSGTFAWQWYTGFPGSGTPIADASGTGLIASYTASPLTSNGLYVIFTDTGISVDATPSSLAVVTSSVATIIVNSAPSITTDISAVLIDNGQTITLTAEVQGGTGPYIWQWYDSQGALGASGTGTTATSSFSTAHDGVYVEFTDTGVSTLASPASIAKVASSVIVVAVAPAPSILTVDTSYIIDTGQSIIIQVTGGSGTFTWQWYSGTLGTGTPISGAYGDGANAEYAPTATGPYYVVFTDTGVSPGSTPVMTTGWSFTVSVYPELNGTVGLSLGSPTTITVGSSTTLSVTPSGGTGTYTYQWAMSNTGVGGPYTNITGATSSSFVFDSTGLPAGTYWFLVWVTDPGTDPYTIHSLPLSITVTPPVTPIPLYSVTFKETGLPAGASWYVNVTGRQSSGAITSSQYTIYLPQGTYNYTVSTSYTANIGETTYAPTSPSGTLTVTSSAVVASVVFTPVQFPILFTETGLPASTVWFVNVTSSTGVEQSFSSSVDTITFYESNGTYSYTVSTENNLYMPYPASGLMVINGTAGFSITIDFTLATYEVLFTELGLPTGSEWTVTLDNGENATSNSQTISFLESNGTYSYSIIAASAGYYASPSSGSVAVNGAAETVEVTFTQTAYPVEFRETGLPAGTTWSVTLNGQTTTSSSEMITFLEPNGVYQYSVGEVAGYVLPSTTGTVTISDSSVNVSITFEKLYPVVVSESGLPDGSVWYFNITGGNSYSSITNSVTFQEPVGTYQYTLSTGNGIYEAVSPTGQFTVITSTSVSVEFAPVTYSVSFTQSGLPAGTEWTVSFNGVAKSAKTESILFSATNGTYPFTISSLSGYKAGLYTGVLKVEGTTVVSTISWEKATYPLRITETGISYGTKWSATLTGTAFDNTTVDITANSTTDQIVFYVPNGTYRYVVHSPIWWVVTNAEGTIAVPGSSSTVAISAQWIVVYIVLGIAALESALVIIATVLTFRKYRSGGK